MEKLLKKHKLSKLTKKDNLSSLITIGKGEFVIKSFPRKTTPGLNGFNGKFFQKLKK